MLKRLLRWADQLWLLGRKSENHYLRFYPNPGFMFTLSGTRVKWSYHDGWSTRKAK